MCKVLVTGGSGFVGAWCVSKLLAAGYAVATTVRNSAREAEVRAMLPDGSHPASALEFFCADLTGDEGWRDAARDCEYVLHVASPVGGSPPSGEVELIETARAGALRVLRAARDAGVKRVVLTSSFVAIGHGHPEREAPFSELDWTDISQPSVAPYARSKVLAERAAWNFMAAEGGEMELVVVNPAAIFGPVLGASHSTSIEIVRGFLNGSVAAVPRTYLSLVDVRDAVDLHLKAMISPVAAGERFIAVAGEPLSLLDMANVLRQELGDSAARVPTEQLSDDAVREFAITSPQYRQIAPLLGKRRRASSAKARGMLGWSPRPNEVAIVAMARSLLAIGLV